MASFESQLKALAQADPAKAEAIAHALLQAASNREIAAEFSGTLADPRASQGGSAKYDGRIDIVDGDGEDVQAIVQVYLPPHLGAEEIQVTVTSVGTQATLRESTPKRRKKKAA